MRDQFGMEACMESVTFHIEVLHKNPFELMGRWIVRSEQDPFFNKTMITALMQYITDHDLKWND